MVPTLKQLRYLAVLCELRNFSRAAEATCVTQSTLSGGIQDLEATLGVTLFERTKRKVIPTPIGFELAARAKRILGEVEGFVEAARAHADPFTGPLRLGVIPTVGPFLLPRLLPLMRDAFPGLRLVLREEQTVGLLARLEAGELDLLILAFPYDAPETDAALFLDDPFWVAAPPGHPLAGMAAVPADALPIDDVLLLEDGHCLREHALAACQWKDRLRHEDVLGTSLYTLLQMVAGGLGVTLVPAMAVGTDMLTGIDIVCRPMTSGTPDRKIGLAWRKTSGRGTAYRKLAGLLAERLGGASPAPVR